MPVRASPGAGTATGRARRGASTGRPRRCREPEQEGRSGVRRGPRRRRCRPPARRRRSDGQERSASARLDMRSFKNLTAHLARGRSSLRNDETDEEAGDRRPRRTRHSADAPAAGRCGTVAASWRRAEGEPPMAHPNEQLLRNGYAAFEKGDLDTLRGPVHRRHRLALARHGSARRRVPAASTRSSGCSAKSWSCPAAPSGTSCTTSSRTTRRGRARHGRAASGTARRSTTPDARLPRERREGHRSLAGERRPVRERRVLVLVGAWSCDASCCAVSSG